jgi:hypothetical protein
VDVGGGKGLVDGLQHGLELLQVVGFPGELGGDHDLVLGDHRLAVVALHGAVAGVQEAAVRVGDVGDSPRVGRLVAGPRLDVRPRLLALRPGRCGQLRDPRLVAALAFGRVGFQPRLGLPQPGQPAGRAGELGGELVPARGAVLAVLSLVGLGRLAQDLGDLVLELGQGAVGPIGGVGSHFGPIQRDDTQVDQPSCGAQPQRLHEQAGQGVLVAGAEPRDGHVVG